MRVANHLTTLDSLAFSDFSNQRLLQSYLAEHDAFIDYDRGEYSLYYIMSPSATLVWKNWGYQLLCGVDAGTAFAERMAFYIVWHTVRGRDWEGLLEEAIDYAKHSKGVSRSSR